MWRKTVDGGEIRGVNAENKALKEQLELARGRQDVVTKEIDILKPDIALLKAEVAQLKSAPIPQRLEAVAVTTGVVADRMVAITEANTALGKTLTVSAAFTP